MFSVRLLVISKLVISFGGVKSYLRIFDCMGGAQKGRCTSSRHSSVVNRTWLEESEKEFYSII